MKVQHKWTDVSFDDNLEYWHEKLPEGNTLPRSTEEAKKVVCPLDLPHVNYDACINDCALYQDEYKELTTCPVCGQSRYLDEMKKRFFGMKSHDCHVLMTQILIHLGKPNMFDKFTDPQVWNFVWARYYLCPKTKKFKTLAKAVQEFEKLMVSNLPRISSRFTINNEPMILIGFMNPFAGS
jgi:hypothetical protein